MDWARAVVIAALRRALASGSGSPILAATVISRESLENRLERFLSWAPLRYMMFLNLLWPAMAVRASCCWGVGEAIAQRRTLQNPSPVLTGEEDSVQPQCRLVGLEQGVGLLAVVGLHLAEADDGADRLGVVAARLGLAVDVLDVVRDCL